MGLVKKLLIATLVVGVVVWTLSAVELEVFQPPQYQPNPQEDVALFQSFIDANIDKKSVSIHQSPLEIVYHYLGKYYTQVTSRCEFQQE